MVSPFVHEHSAGINERMLCTKDAVNILNHFANNCVQLQHWIYIIQIIVLSFFFFTRAISSPTPFESPRWMHITESKCHLYLGH